MCGVAGFVGQGDRDDLAGMLEVLHHRGPDATGSWIDPEQRVHLGHRRLSIIDLEGGAQPMSTRDGRLIVTFNGEIYNHLELRAQLESKGHIFTSDHSDTEVLLHGYREWGSDLPSRLNGMWAFAIFDRANRTLLLSRDRFGKKPLFYGVQNGTLAFASELRALTRLRHLEASIDPLAVRKLFAYGYVPAPRSLLRGISKLGPGQNLHVDVSTLSCRVETYWRFVLEPDESLAADEAKLCEEIRDRLAQAVARRMMSDVPLTIFLSGGIDSSAIASYARKARGGAPVSSFSIGFEEASFDESQYARQVASLVGTEHHERLLSMEMASGLVEEIAGALDEPVADSSLLPSFLLCRSAREVGTVALSGDGGDEMFAGYDPFLALRLAKLYSSLVPEPVHRGIRMLAGRLPTSHGNISVDFMAKRTLRGLSYPQELWNPVWMGPLEPKELEDLFSEPIEEESLYSEAIEAWDACAQPDIVDKTLQFYTNLYLCDDILVKMDRMSMLNSLEVRSPFLDIELVDLVRKIPHRLKLRGRTTKYILKKALEPILPKAILHRSKKGFGAPIGRWLQSGRIQVEAGSAVNQAAGLGQGASAAFLAARQREHTSGSHDHRLYLWAHYLLSRSALLSQDTPSNDEDFAG